MASPTVSPAPSGSPAPIALPSGLPASAVEVLTGAYFVHPDYSYPDGVGRFVVGAPGRMPITLPMTTEDSDVVISSGRVTAATRSEDGWIIRDVDPATGTLTELHRTADRTAGRGYMTATRDASGTRVYLLTPGIRVVDLGTGEERELVPGEAGEFRTEVQWSPSGETFASAACDMLTCVVDVVDTATNTVTQVREFVLSGITDRYLISHRSTEDFRWLLHDVERNESTPLAHDVLATAYDGYAVDEDLLVLSGRDSDEVFKVVIVDLRTGEPRVVFQRAGEPLRALFEFFRSPDWAVLGGEGGLVDAIVQGGSFDLLNLHDGTVIEGALPVVPAKP